MVVLAKQPQYRKQLSKNQIELLGLVGKFRFVTVPLLSEWRSKDKSTVYERLLVLTEQGYLHKTYDKSWKLLGKPAVYSLATKGIKALRDKTDWFPKAVYKNQYKNRSASLQLVDHSLDVFKLCVQLRKQHGTSIEYFAKSEITKFEQFIRPLPDLYLRMDRRNEDDQLIHYQLETIEAGTFTWMLKKRINAHQDWFDENNDEDWGFEDNYPTLLLLCDNKSTEKRIHRLTDEAYMDFETWTTTRERFESNSKDIWIHYLDEYENDGVMRGL
jgi:hypothetical protein